MGEMTVSQDSVEIRRRVHTMWGSVAPAWDRYAPLTDERGRGLAERLLSLTAPGPGDRVLELAAGAGGVGMAAAALVGASGEVVISDVAPEMTAIAARRAREAGLARVRTRELDLEEIDEADASFDVVVCREGLMLAVDHARALSEIHRILRAGGRFAASVWGPRERNPWLSITMSTVSAEIGKPLPPPGIPGPFALEDAERLLRLTIEAGFTDARVDEEEVPLRESFDDWTTRRWALAGPIAGLVAALPDDARARLRARLREAVRPYERDGVLEFPGVALVVSGRRGGEGASR